MKQKLYSEFVETVTWTRLCAGDFLLDGNMEPRSLS